MSVIYRGDVGKLDAEGQSLIFRASDLKARFMLIDAAEAAYDAGHKAESATLVHAYQYLTDRLAYELYPWPKNCIRLP